MSKHDKLIRNAACLVLLALLVPLHALDITGTVLDAETGQPVSSVTVEIKNTSVKSVTSADGKFGMDLPGTNIRDRVSALGPKIDNANSPVMVYTINGRLLARNIRTSLVPGVLNTSKDGTYLLAHADGSISRVIKAGTFFHLPRPVVRNNSGSTKAKAAGTASIVMEAETMQLNGYVVDPATSANGNRTLIKVDPARPLGSTGTAVSSFTGPAGTYHVSLYTVLENDGASPLKFSIGSKLVLDEKLPYDPKYMQTASEVYEFRYVTLKSGDQLKLQGTSATDGGANHGSYARVDKIVFTDIDNVTLSFSKEGYVTKEIPARKGDSGLTVRLTPMRIGDKPGAHNTGPSGTLTPSGGMTISSSGAVIQNREINGMVMVKAPNVTIRNCRIISSAIYGIHALGGSGTLIENCEIAMRTFTNRDGRRGLGKCIYGNSMTIRHCEIKNGMDGVFGNLNITMEGNWIHSLGKGADGLIPYDPHCDGFQMQQGGNHVLKGNFFDHCSNSAIFISSAKAPWTINNITIEANWLFGGNYTVYVIKHAAYSESKVPTNVRIINNRFSRDYKFGPMYVMGSQTISGNVWDDTGQLMGK